MPPFPVAGVDPFFLLEEVFVLVGTHLCSCWKQAFNSTRKKFAYVPTGMDLSKEHAMYNP